MDFVRRHGFIMGCVLAGLGGMALIMTGLGAMPKVVAEMEKTKSLYAELNSLQSVPANERSIAAERERIQATRDDYDKVIAKGRELYRYQPLVPDVFPAGNDESRRQFRRQYATAMRELLKLLRAGQPALPSEVELMKEKIANEKRRAEESQAQTGAPPSTAPGAPPRTPAGVLTVAGARENPKVRADLAAAQKIYCYATSFDDVAAKPGSAAGKAAASSLDFDATMHETGTIDAPSLEHTWRAQLGYWIQKDVVDAIIAVNGEAAEKALGRNEERWVGIMPVKDIISIRVCQDYVPAEGEAYAGVKPGGSDPALPPCTPKTVFTHSGQSPSYEVLQFTLKLIMDQRDIPRLIERISANGAHTLLRVAYKAVPPNKEMTDKIYGSEPVVNVVMDFETIMLGDVFRPLMPAAVCEQYQIPCSKPKEKG